MCWLALPISLQRSAEECGLRILLLGPPLTTNRGLDVFVVGHYIHLSNKIWLTPSSKLQMVNILFPQQPCYLYLLCLLPVLDDPVLADPFLRSEALLKELYHRSVPVYAHDTSLFLLVNHHRKTLFVFSCRWGRTPSGQPPAFLFVVTAALSPLALRTGNTWWGFISVSVEELKSFIQAGKALELGPWDSCHLGRTSLPEQTRAT